MKRILIIAILALIAYNTDAQSITGSPQNTGYDKKFDGFRGYFNYAMSSTETVSVSYNFTPLSPKDAAKLYLQTPFAMPFWATITNQSGKTVSTWKPVKPEYKYAADFDLSKLKTGVYTLNIYVGTDSKSAFNLNFSKE